MNRAVLIMIGIAGGAAAVFLVAAGSKAKAAAASTPAPASSSAPPPWMSMVPPGIVPTKVKSRDTSTTSFPIDVWSSSSVIAPNDVVAVASDDPTSFVVYDSVLKTIFARGPGPLTAQIAAQI